MNPLISAVNLSPAMQSNISSRLGQLSQLKNMLRGGNPNQMMIQMANSNPQFRQFIQNNQGKSPQQIAQNYGLDWNQVSSLLK